MYERIDKIFNYDEYDVTNDNIVYTDTDSVFILKGNRTSEEIENIVNKYSNKFSRIINGKFTNSNDLCYKFKVEYDIDTIVLYGKKMYFVIRPDNSIEIVGLEGKKETFGIAKDILENIIKFFIECKNSNIEISEELGIKFINKLYYHYYNEILKLKDLWKTDPKFVIDQIGFPVNISKEVKNLKAVSSYYRGVLIFDYFYKLEYNTEYWKNNLNGKGYHVYVKLNEEYIKSLNLDSKIIGKEIFGMYKNVIKTFDINDITIPDMYTDNETILNYLNKIFDLNVDLYEDLINQKISRLGACLSNFCDKKKTKCSKYLVLTKECLAVKKNLINIPESVTVFKPTSTAQSSNM